MKVASKDGEHFKLLCVFAWTVPIVTEKKIAIEFKHSFSADISESKQIDFL